MHRRLTNPKFHVSFSPINPRTLSRVLVTAHQKVRAMAFFRKAGNILSRTVSNHISQEISSSQPSIFQAIRCMSTSKLFIGGLSYSTDDSGLREAFSKYGEVADAKVIVDRDTGRSRGFGFVTFSTVEDATAAIQALDEQHLHGRRVRVAYANERTRGYGGGGGFGSGGYGGNYGNDGGFGGNYGGGGSGSGYGGNYGSGGGGGYGGNYRSGGGGGGYGGNFGSGGRGGAGYGGNFDNAAGGEDGYTGGGNLSHSGGQNFGGPVGGSGGSYASNASYGGGDLPGSDGQNFGVAGGGGGTDNSFVSSEVGQFKFDAEESKSTEGAADGYSQDEPLEGNYRDDDDTPNNYADRRG